jgi:hypothetical protein
MHRRHGPRFGAAKSASLLATVFARVLQKCLAGCFRLCSSFLCHFPEPIIVMFRYLAACDSQVTGRCQASGHAVLVKSEQPVFLRTLNGCMIAGTRALWKSVSSTALPSAPAFAPAPAIPVQRQGCVP